MVTVGIFVRLEAKAGKEEELAVILMQGLELANQERTTSVWFALRLVGGSLAIFDAFADEQDGKLISTELLPKRSWRRLPIYLQSLR
jgi:hypothetical protein